LKSAIFKINFKDWDRYKRTLVRKEFEESEQLNIFDKQTVNLSGGSINTVA